MADANEHKDLEGKVSKIRQFYESTGKNYVPYGIMIGGIMLLGYFNERYKTHLNAEEKKTYDKDLRGATIVATAAGVADLATRKF